MRRRPTAEDDPTRAVRPRSRIKRALLWFGALVLLAGIAAVGAYQIAGVARDLRDAENLVDSAAANLRDGDLGAAQSALARAERLVLDANESLRTSLIVDVASWVPGARDNVRSLEDSIELATTVIHGGVRILDVAGPLQSEEGTLEVSLSDGSIPLEAVEAVEKEITDLYLQLVVAPRPKGSSFLFPQVRELEEAVWDEASRRRSDLEILSNGLALMEEITGAERPRRYLLAIANTAEMRGTGGMMLNYGVLEGADGTVDFTEFGRVGELDVPPNEIAAEVGLPDDYLARWDGFDVTTEWRNATMSGDFSLVAPVLELMYQRATGLPVDGVVQIDPAGLAAMLAGVGPVTVPEVGEVTAENVEALVLNEAYRRYPGVEERTDVLGDVAEAAFTRLVEGEFASIRGLAEAIAHAVDGRHIIVHSKTSRTAAAVESFGAEGSLPPPETLDYAHLTVQNMSGNKLDYYLDTHLDVTGPRSGGDIDSWQVDITLTNTAPAGEVAPPYIFGPIDETQRAGLYRGAVTLYLPTGSSLVSASPGEYRLPPSVQTEDGRPLVGFWVDVPAGESRTVTLELSLPPRGVDGAYELLLVPSPRVRPTTADVAIDTRRGRAEASVTLDRRWVVTDRGEPRPLSGV